MDIKRLRSYIQSFSFDQCKRGSQGFDRILIQLFGLLGHGKSSFINTCIYAWEDGEFQNWSKAKDAIGGGDTTERIPYPLTENITLVDNRGCATLGDHETGEIFAQLGNLLPLGKSVEWSQGFGLADRMVNAEKVIRTSDFVFPVFVHSVKKEITMNDKEELKKIFHTARNLTGVFPIVVLTHKTWGTLVETEGIFRDIGVDRIFSFENYTMEDHKRIRGKHEGVLKFLYEVIEDVKFRVEEPRDPLKEMEARRKFVLNYIHECRQKEVQRNEKREKAKELALQKKRLEQLEEAKRGERQREQMKQDEEFRRTQAELGMRINNERAAQDEIIRAQTEKQHKNRRSAVLNLFKRKKK